MKIKLLFYIIVEAIICIFLITKGMSLPHEYSNIAFMGACGWGLYCIDNLYKLFFTETND